MLCHGKSCAGQIVVLLFRSVEHTNLTQENIKLLDMLIFHGQASFLGQEPSRSLLVQSYVGLY